MAKKRIILSEEQKRYILTESIEDVCDYLSMYDAKYVLDNFEPGKKLQWGPLINPSMYQRALNVFTQTGSLDDFPSKYVYQWMGIIMKNIAILKASNEIFGHAPHYPMEYIEDFVAERYNGFIGKDKESAYIPTTEKEFLSTVGNLLNEENGIHRNGQYDLFLNQEETDEWDEWYDKRQVQKKFEQYVELAEKYKANRDNRYYYVPYFEVDVKNMQIYKVWGDWGYFFDEIGVYDYLVTPDGTEAISDYGLEPLIETAAEYDSEMPPEDVLVLINRILDITHQRGDLSCMFITGGKKTLSQISNAEYVINEARLLREHKDIVDEFDVAVDLIREQWTSPDDAWYVKIDARYKDFRGYNRRHGYNYGNPRMIYWKQVDRTDGTRRENHVGFVIITGKTADEAVNNLLNCTVKLNPWAAKQMRTREVTSKDGKGGAIRQVCDQFFARAYMTINPRSLSVSRNKAEDYKRKGIFRGREINHALGQSKADDDPTIKWTALRPYGLIDCDVDNEKGWKELEDFLDRNGIKPFRTYLSHDGKHYVLKNRDAQKLNFGFMKKYDTNNRPGDPNVLFKGDANMLLFSAVGV